MLKIFGRTTSSHLICFRFLPTFEHFRTGKEHKIGLLQGEKSTATGQKIFNNISTGNNFRADPNNSLTGDPTPPPLFGGGSLQTIFAEVACNVKLLISSLIIMQIVN